MGTSFHCWDLYVIYDTIERRVWDRLYKDSLSMIQTFGQRNLCAHISNEKERWILWSKDCFFVTTFWMMHRQMDDCLRLTPRNELHIASIACDKDGYPFHEELFQLAELWKKVLPFHMYSHVIEVPVHT